MARTRRGSRRVLVAVAASVVAASCSTSGGGADPPPTSSASGSPEPVVTVPAGDAVDGAMETPSVLDLTETAVRSTADAPAGDVELDDPPLRLDVGDVPRWIVGADGADGTLLLTITEADRAHAASITAAGARAVPFAPADVRWQRPPLLVRPASGEPALLMLPADAAPDAPGAVLDDALAYVGDDGALVVRGGDDRYDLDLLPDGWIVPVSPGRVAVLAAPTEAYGHGVLGDAVESDHVLVVDTADGDVATRIDVDGVVESVRPTVGRLPGIDEDLLVVTVSDAEGGADVVAYTLDGQQVASTGPIGTGNRWRHLIAVDGDTGLVEVVTPHLGKELRVSTPAGDDLEVALSLPGTMGSHTIGSRSLDEAKLLSVDGRPAVVGPGPDRSSLVAIAADDGTVLAEHDLGGVWASNLAAVPVGDGVLVAVGLEDGTVLVWPPAS